MQIYIANEKVHCRMEKTIQVCLYIFCFLNIAKGNFQIGIRTGLEAREAHADCEGSIVLCHGPRDHPLSDLRMKTFERDFYPRIGSDRRRIILNAEVRGNCVWYVYSHPEYRGKSMTLGPGFDSPLDFIPKSMSFQHCDTSCDA